MRHPSHWKIIAVVTAMLAGVAFVASPGFAESQKTTNIVAELHGGSGQISTNYAREDAANLVLVLRSHPLPAPITFISMTTEGQ